VKKRPINVEAVVARIAPKLSSDLRALAAAIRTLDLTELRQWGDLVESNLQKAAVLGGKVSANVRQANALTLTSSSSPAAQRLSGTTVSKETYYSVKRDLLHCQKRPTTVSKETYYSVKRDLLKRPTIVSKETYYSVKRDLLLTLTSSSSPAALRLSPESARERESERERAAQAALKAEAQVLKSNPY